MKLLVVLLITVLLTYSFPIIAGNLVTIDASNTPSYQAIIEPVRLSNDKTQKSTFVINMADDASFRLGGNSAETSKILVERSDIPGKDFIVSIDLSVIFESDMSMGLNRSVQQLSSQLPLSDGERILVGGNRATIEENAITREITTEVWFTLKQHE